MQIPKIIDLNEYRQAKKEMEAFADKYYKEDFNLEDLLTEDEINEIVSLLSEENSPF